MKGWLWGALLGLGLGAGLWVTGSWADDSVDKTAFEAFSGGGEKTLLPSSQSLEFSVPGVDFHWLVQKTLSRLEVTHRWLSQSTGRLGANLDRFLSKSRTLEFYNGTKVILSWPLTYHLNGTVQAVPRLNAKFDLSQLNQKWKIFVRSFNEEQQTERISTTVSEHKGNDTAQFGVRYQTSNRLNLLNYVDLGVSAKGLQDWPSIYTRYKSEYRLGIFPEPWRQSVSGKVFWDSAMGVGGQFAHRLDYEMSVIQVVYRSETQFNWWDHGQYWDIYQDFILFQKISERYSAASFVGWNWQTRPERLHLHRFSGGVKVRKKLYKQWLFFEMKPLITFREETHFNEADLSMTFQLEVQFYQQRP